MKKTDWQIIRDLSDFILSLGHFEHDIYNNKGELSKNGDGVKLYTDGKYVSCVIIKNGERTMEFTCHKDSFRLPDLTPKNKNIKDVKFPDARELNRVYRRKLRPMIENTLKRKMEQKKLKIKKLKEELNKLKETK